MKIITLPIEKINPAPYNPRLDLMPGDPDYDRLEKVMAEFDLVEPLVWNKRSGNLVSGHQRLKILKARGDMQVKVSVVDLTESKEKALNLALNKTGGDWDLPALKDLLLELEGLDLDFELTGFSEGELEDLTAQFRQDEVLEDEVPEPPEEPITKPGDLWILGEHRLLCGDATVASDIERLMGGKKADMVFTDPPWNVAIGLDSNPRHRQRPGLKNDNLSANDFRDFLAGVAATIADVCTGDVYCVLGASEWPSLDLALRGAGLHWSATIIWVKDSFVLGRSKYHRRYEPIWYGWKAGEKSSFCARRDLDDVWEIPRPKRSEEHPTMKPVSLVARATQNSSRSKGLVFDPFLGSGTTLIAAEQLGRTCYGTEIDPGYCDVIVARWENLTGEKARLAGGVFNKRQVETS